MVEDWMTVQAAVEFSGYHPERIRELAREGKIKSRKFATVWQVSRQSLVAYLKMQDKTHGKKRGRPKTKLTP